MAPSTGSRTRVIAESTDSDVCLKDDLEKGLENGDLFSLLPQNVLHDTRISTNKKNVIKDTKETQTDCDPDAEEARIICFDMVEMAMNGGDLRKAKSTVSNTMWRLVNEILEKHAIVYKSMVEKLGLVTRPNYWSLKTTCDELFIGGEVSWGRIIALYALCVQVAISRRERDHKEVAHAVADFVGFYVGENVSQWIKSQGGWMSLVDAFPLKDNLERKVWKGLLVTGLSLGMLATVIKTIR